MWDDLTLCSLVMVELRTRKREKRGDGGNQYEKQGLHMISYTSQFPFPTMIGRSPDLAGNESNLRSS